MTLIEHSWRDLCEKQRACDACRSTNSLHPVARPLFGHFRPRPSGVLFVFEAPNLGDTTEAGYITYDTIARTDETGKFTKDLFEQEIGMQWHDFQVTNAVLCLPQNKNGKHPVKAMHLRNCAANLRQQIELLQPRVIASVGNKALRALRRLYGLRNSGLRKVVGHPPELLQDGRWLFPLFHTSRQGRWSRSEEHQRADWRALANFIRKNGLSLHD